MHAILCTSTYKIKLHNTVSHSHRVGNHSFKMIIESPGITEMIARVSLV